MQFDLSLAIILLASSFSAATLALLLAARLTPRHHVKWTPLEQMGDPVAFLFEERRLVDATPKARDLLESGPAFLDDLSRVVAALGQNFPDLVDELPSIEERQRLLLRSEDGSAELEAEWRMGLVRIVVRHDNESTRLPDRLSQQALLQELATLRGVVDDAPVLTWKEDAGGAVRWANGAYVDLARQVAGDDQLGWPLPRVFDKRPVGPDAADPPRRLSVRLSETEDPIWFDCFNEQQGDETLVFALPADKLVRAEASLREFVQTLTKTFAHLPTGLAVFDRERRLALFNPALTDLSELEPLFLSGRPTLFEVLDRLREKQRMPEPKNYKGWRQQIMAMETAAASGTHQETWTLPNGQTIRVTGRPHPEGALAFLFEDISAEISLTRRFRSELAIGQSVIDSLDEAIAVFSSSGTLIMSNTAYETLWKVAPGATLGETGIVEATRLWQDASRPTPVWGDLRDFVRETGERAEWSADVFKRDGALIACRFKPLPGHATLAAFTPGVLSDLEPGLPALAIADGRA